MKTILITGASRGIGAATALLAAEHGYSVAVNYHKNKEQAQNIAHQVEQKGARAEIFQADVGSNTDVIRLFKEVDESLGKINCLVNNAGILDQQTAFEHIHLERIQHIFAVNVYGTMLCCQEAIKRMSLKHGAKGGSIINISSLAARTGSPFEYIDYAASKAAIDSLTLGLSKELAEVGIRVNAVRPAFIHTDIHAAGGEPQRIGRIKNTIPLQRGGYAHEVAEAIIWLASDKASFCTGTILDVTGGK